MGKHRTRARALAVVVSALLLAAACTAGDDGGGEPEAADDTAVTEETGDTSPVATGPAPGVTDDTVKIGVTHVDAESLIASGIDLNLGEHEAVYTALFDAINAGGGIHGRQIEAVFAPIDPTSSAPAEEACVELTEDEDVFAVVGFFLTDAVLCTVATHATAVVGGDMTPERLNQAEAPWVTPTPDTDQPAAVTATYAEQGHLDGTVGIYANARDQSVLDDVVLPALEEAGIEPAEVGVASSPPDDTAALDAEIQTIGQRFEAAGVDTLLIVGESGTDWPTAMIDQAYRPQLLFLESVAVVAYATNAATTDTSILEGALAGGPYGPDQARFEEAAMQECIATLDEAGLDTPEPASVGDEPSNQPYQAAFQACPDVALLAAVLEAAGEDLNYGTLEAAMDGLEVPIPGDPEPRTYGPAPDADGDPTAYLFEWSEANQVLELIE